MYRPTSVKLGVLAAALLAGAAVAAPDERLQAARPVFDPAIFFAGRTVGEGTIDIVFKKAEPLRVQGNGRIEPDGSLILDQVVRRGPRPVERRQWRFRKLGPARYAGTLSDATGPVGASVQGNRLHLRYPMKGGLQAEQWIYLRPDGRSAINRMTIRKLGMVVARIDETIRKQD
jgi:hypothetical protein